MDSLQRNSSWFLAPKHGTIRFAVEERSLRHAVTLAVAAGTALIAICAHAQQTYPDHPVRLIAPFVPGGLVDTDTRAIKDRLGVRLG